MSGAGSWQKEEPAEISGEGQNDLKTTSGDSDLCSIHWHPQCLPVGPSNILKQEDGRKIAFVIKEHLELLPPFFG